jgi:Tfp pilus assembly protein PilP
VKYLLLVPLLTLAGCAGERVKDLGDGMHSVTACAEDRITNSQVLATRAANQYCEKTGREAVVDTFDDQACPKSEMSTTRVVFACR